MRSAIKRIVLVAVSAVLLTGCMSFNPKSLRSMETALMQSNPDIEIESTMKFGLGALTMDFVDFAFVHNRSVDISKISRADIGIYELRGTLAVDGFTVPQDVAGDRSCPRREVIVRVREESGHTQIAVCIKDEKITGFSLFVLEPTEIVVINARGDFESLINSVVKAHMSNRDRDAESRASNDHEQTSGASTVAMR